MRYEIRFAGFGGQGIITAGRLLALIIMEANPKVYVVYSPSYGFQTRGGDAISDVIISDEEIDYPKTRKLDLAVLLSQPAYNKYCMNVKDDGLLIIDQYINTQPQCTTKRRYAFNIVASARGVGGDVFTSSVILGVAVKYLEYTPLFKNTLRLEVAEHVIAKYFRETVLRRELNVEDLVMRNTEALRLGYRMMSNIIT